MKSDYKCPICGDYMLSFRGDGVIQEGFTLRCDSSKCLKNENVFGYGHNEKTAYEKACQKYNTK